VRNFIKFTISWFMLLSCTLVYAQNSGTTTKIPGSHPDLAEGYRAKWIEQKYFLQARNHDLVRTNPQPELTPDAEGYIHLAQGDNEVRVEVKFQNVGTTTWVNKGDDRKVCISIYKDKNVLSAPRFTGYDDSQNSSFGQSIFGNSSFISNYKVACLDQAEVQPNAFGTFTIQLVIDKSFMEKFIPGPGDKQYLLSPYKLREDISLSSGPYWIQADAAYPKGTGDPLGVAHIWVGLKFTPDSVDSLYVDAAEHCAAIYKVDQYVFLEKMDGGAPWVLKFDTKLGTLGLIDRNPENTNERAIECFNADTAGIGTDYYVISYKKIGSSFVYQFAKFKKG